MRLVHGVLVALVLAGPAYAEHTRLRLHGSNTVGARLAPALATGYAQARGWAIAGERREGEATTIELSRGADTLRVEIEAHGTGTGYAALVEGRADLWMASRPATPGEVDGARAIGRLDAPAQEHVIALDGLAVIVHPANPVAALDVADVARMFRGELRDWSQLGGPRMPVSLHARDDRSGTFDTFRTLVLRGGALSSRAARYESSDRLAAAVLRERGAIGFVGLASVGRARAVGISDGGAHALLPGELAVATEDYALSRRLFLYNRADAPALVRDFVEFALGDAGQRTAERIGFVAQEIRALRVPPRDDADAEYAALTRGALRLSVNFRFSDGIGFLDTKALRDLDRLVQWVRSTGISGRELMLFGFADANEANPVQAIGLSTERADYVAAELARHGIGAGRIRGVGDAAPVADDATGTGRSRNRRVEVWLAPPGPAADVVLRAAQASRDGNAGVAEDG